MASENVNNAAAVRKSVQSTNSQVTNIKGPERVAEDKPAFKPDFSEAQKGPSVPSSRNHLVQPESSEEQAQRNYAVNLNLEFREDDYDSVSFDLSNKDSNEGTDSSFAQAENDQIAILTAQQPEEITANIVETTLMDARDGGDLDFDLGIAPEESIIG
jgi:hypothetical protein